MKRAVLALTLVLASATVASEPATATVTSLAPAASAASAAPAASAPPAAAATSAAVKSARWLFVSDVHLNPHSASGAPSPLGEDTNEALLRSALAEMKRVAPAPPVVVIAGDFLAHKFNGREAKAAMAHVAVLFGQAFPKAQFVLALGNNDSTCGSYVTAPNAPFFQDTAVVWGPLVNRHGEAPDFMKTFPRDGYYTAKLPIPGLRAVVINDTFWSPRFRAGCGSTEIDGSEETLADLDRALPPGGPGKAWVVLHIPPGIDAFSTVNLAQRLAIVPFLETAPRNRLLAMLGDRRRNVALAVTGHTHKFAFRLAGSDGPAPLPILMVPSLSPVFRNNPMFLTADVAPDGTIREVEAHAYGYDAWRDAGGSRDLGLQAFTGPELAVLRQRLAVDPNLRGEFARLYDGGARPEITPANWRGYWCAIDAMSSTDYRACTGQRGYSFITARGFLVTAIVAAPILLAVLLAAFYFMRSPFRT